MLYVFYIWKLKSITTEKIAHKLLIDFAELFSYMYLFIQYLLVLIMTPAYVGSAIAEEKERRTLEFLLATDLRSQEIIFGKVASRLGNMLMFLLAGLPVLAFVLFFGGVDPELLKNGFLATLATLFSLTAVSIVCSVQAKRSRDGILRSYFVVAGYFIFGFLISWLVTILQGRFFGGGGTWSLNDSDLTLKSLCYFTEFYLSGDMFHAIYLYATNYAAPFMGNKSWTGVDLGTSLDALLRNYLIFHVTLAILCLLYAVWQLRPIFVRQTYGDTRRKRYKPLAANTATVPSLPKRFDGTGDTEKTIKPRGRRFQLRNWPPMIWKELLVPRQSKRTWRARLFTAVQWAVFLLPIPIIIILTSNFHYVRWDDLGQSLNMYARIAGTVCMVLMIFAAGIRAANAVCNERDQETLDTLLSTVLTDRNIIWGKWLGAALGYGPSLYLLLIIWTICLVTGALAIDAVLLLILALVIYSGFASAIGLFFSAGAKNTTRSLLGTLFWLIIWMGGHWVFIGLILLFTASGDMREITNFLFGMTPPFVLFSFAYPITGFVRDEFMSMGHFQRFAWIGLFLNALLTLLFLALAQQRFYLNTGRIHNLVRKPVPPSIPSSAPAND
ncbi:MAG: ABC transporter permease subunit [Gemmatales bacterium]